ncbi:protein of unknown function DUF214 [Alkaliphilus metalliredigens QYMF]|uniref:Cell division protein FtsX n=1 Tax=Alkaliphilus metalliredigens (strain QYMF) TaxID=293826 RepID=A6TVJ3_ALKMQ|nr:permease-like cell division protein FtsX [Alkaliphilus metalliredigens]ABR50211.1 protein of unknown function DUF214 [Alkaliphilus metalliredigens QYMF]
MKIKTINYVFKQGMIGLWRNRGMSIASISSVMTSLLVLGLIITLVLNINNVALLAQTQFDSVQVYLDEELELESIRQIGEDVSEIQGVAAVEYESSEQALANMKEQWGEQGYLLDNLESNPLPNSYIIHLEGLEVADEVVSELEAIEGIEEVKYYKEIMDQLMNIAGLIRTVGFVLILALILVTVFIISNTIKLTLNARRQEINIMKYVGATNWFVRWPFIIEGVFLGLIGSVLALVFVYYGYQYVFNAMTTQFYIMLSTYMVPIEEMMNKTIVIFAVLGAGVGALGSIFSLRKHLRV